jgi:hypothetical protein
MEFPLPRVTTKKIFIEFTCKEMTKESICITKKKKKSISRKMAKMEEMKHKKALRPWKINGKMVN